MMWLLLIVTLSFGAKPQTPKYVGVKPQLNTYAPGTGYFAVELSPGTRIVEYPRNQPTIAQIALYGNNVPLTQQLKTVNTRWIADTQVWSVGDGAWFLTFYLDESDVEVKWESQGEFTIFTLAKGKPKPPPPELEVLNGYTLATDPPDRLPLPPPSTLLHPFYGDGLTIKIDPRLFSLSFTPWRPTTSKHPLAKLAEAPPTNWAAVEGYRTILGETRSLTMRSLAYYLLGIAHYNLGLPREATYYLGEALKTKGNWPKPTVYLAHAQAAMSAGRWDLAKASCTKAIEYGAEDVLGLECLTIVALETGSPSPSHVATALLNESDQPIHAVLAANLFLIDGQHGQAFEALDPIIEKLPRYGYHWTRIAWANHGDALLGMGEFVEAQRSFGRAGHTGDLGELVRSRRRMIQILIDGPRTWGARMTDLRDRAEQDGPLVHAENYFLMAQIAKLYDDPTLAMEYLRKIQRHHTKRAEKADIGGMMIDICRNRLEQLHAHGRLADEAAFFQECWQPELDRAIEDTSHMQRVVRTYEDLGLYNKAMLLQIRVLAIQTALKNVLPEEIAHLAHLYAETGRPEETFKTTDFIRDLPNGKRIEPQLRLIEARSIYRDGALEDAEKAYLKAAQLPSVRDEARIRLALVHADQRRCADALPVLQTAIANPAKWPVESVGPEHIYLTTARCLVDTKAYDTAETAIEELRAKYPLHSAAMKASTEYLDIVSSMLSSGTHDKPIDNVDGIWKKLVDEEAQHQNFTDTITNR
jgi:tetratricopeptide (TPR) repeat protein